MPQLLTIRSPTFVSSGSPEIDPVSCPSVVPRTTRSAPPNPVRFLSQNHNSFPTITAPKPTRRHANQPSTTSLHRPLSNLPMTHPKPIKSFVLSRPNALSRTCSHSYPSIVLRACPAPTSMTLISSMSPQILHVPSRSEPGALVISKLFWIARTEGGGISSVRNPVIRS
jgi:hypothetical protein